MTDMCVCLFPFPHLFNLVGGQAAQYLTTLPLSETCMYVRAFVNSEGCHHI